MPKVLQKIITKTFEAVFVLDSLAFLDDYESVIETISQVATVGHLVLAYGISSGCSPNLR